MEGTDRDFPAQVVISMRAVQPWRCDFQAGYLSASGRASGHHFHHRDEWWWPLKFRRHSQLEAGFHDLLRLWTWWGRGRRATKSNPQWALFIQNCRRKPGAPRYTFMEINAVPH
jgi:hypothetical protein